MTTYVSRETLTYEVYHTFAAQTLDTSLISGHIESKLELNTYRTFSLPTVG